MDITTTPTTRVSRIQIQRLHNLGNYESIRYEVTVDVAPGDNAATILSNLETALEDIQCECDVSKSRYEMYLLRMSEPTDKNGEPWTEREISNAKEGIAKYEAVLARREAARELLTHLHVVRERRDAKENWDEDEY